MQSWGSQFHLLNIRLGEHVEESVEILLEVGVQGVCCEIVSSSNVRSYTHEFYRQGYPNTSYTRMMRISTLPFYAIDALSSYLTLEDGSTAGEHSGFSSH